MGNITQKDYNIYHEKINFRIFKPIFNQVQKIVRYSVDKEGQKKYQNISHFIRAAIMARIKIEYKEVSDKRGRPIK